MNMSQRNGRINGKARGSKPLPGTRLKCYGFCPRGECPLRWQVSAECPKLPRRGTLEDYISIPAPARGLDISSLDLSARLQHILGWKGFRVLGDLHGQHLSDLRRWRNCGKVTACEVLGLVRCLQHARWKPQFFAGTDGMADGYEI